MKRATHPATQVLVVDDCVATRARVCGMLTELGLEPFPSPAYAPAVLHAIAQRAPRCVVIDVPVKDRGGLQLLSSIRAACPGCLVIVLTNHHGPELERTCREHGVDHFLDKSTQFERVAELVAAFGEEE